LRFIENQIASKSALDTVSTRKGVNLGSMDEQEY